MAGVTIRNLDDRLKTRLKVQAAEHGHSMEEEARRILRDALSADPPNLADLAVQLFGPKRGIELVPHIAITPRSPPTFD